MEPVRRKFFRTNVRKPRGVLRPVSMKECALPNEGPELQQYMEENKEGEPQARSE
jgi:hypothetical protein